MAENAETPKLQSIKVDIIEQKMKAVVVIKAPQDVMEDFATTQDVINALNKSGVKFGINEETINENINEQKWGEMFVAAVGTNPATGDDAGLEYHFSTQKSLKPQVTEDGRIDYKEVNVVNSVNKDDLLLRKIPATQGEPGTNVLGEIIPGKFGKDISVVAGVGTYKDPKDELLIKSSLDGIVFYNPKSKTVEVQKLYVIPGSVDYSTGNVHVKSSIEIKGNVKPGFAVTTPYDVNILGTVEHATITCDGDMKVKEGIVGDGKQIIKVGGDLHSGYINNQIVKCGGSVYAGTEIRSSTIECVDEVVVVKVSGVIIGGKITASNKITAQTVGNLYNVPTELEVGVNFEFKEKYLHKIELRNGVQKQIEEYRNKIELINSKPPDLGSNARLKTLKTQLQDAIDQLEKQKKDLKEIEKDYYNIANPTISVTKTVFPGTIIKIKHAVLEVKEELTHVMFKLDDDKVEYVKLR